MGTSVTLRLQTFPIHFTSQVLKMLRVLVLSLCVALSVQESTKSDGGWVKPSFCKNLDCPRFAVLQQGEDFELRQYEEALWVSTEAETIDGTINESLFMKLFRYISGGNANGEVIAMTAPVLNKITPGTGPNCATVFRQSFFVPFSHQESAPAPTAEDVFLETKQTIQVYVRSFSGYASTNDYLMNLSLLAEFIGDQSKFRTDYYMTAGYDSPFQPFNRHNEVWLVAVN